METQTRVFEYGCLPPVAGQDKMIDVLFKRNRLWNALVEIERDFRKQSEALITPQENPLDAIQSEIEQLRGKIKEQRKSARKSVDTSELKEKIKELRAQCKVLYPIIKEQRKKLIAEQKEQLGVLEKERREKVKEAYHQSGLWWGNYNDVINNSYNVARIRAMKEGTGLRFHRFDGTGKVSVQIQGGIPVEDIFLQKNNLLQIDPVDAQAWICPIRSERKKMTQTVVRIRIGSMERQPIWLELPMVLHRPLPVGGIIKAASVIREKVGYTFRYRLIITVTYPAMLDMAPAKKGAVGIDLGWRVVPGGMRVAYWVDTEGESKEFVLPQAIIDRMNTLNGLKSTRDKHFNDAVMLLKSWLQGKTIPEEIADKVKFLSQWRSPIKFFYLMKVWNENRFSGDQEMVAFLNEYLKRDKHLYDWQSNLRDKVMHRRRDLYRVFAHQLTRYAAIVIEKFDLKKMSKKQKPEKGTKGTLPSDTNRTIAAVGLLREIIGSAAARNGISVISIEAEKTTITCHCCGHVEKFEAGKQIHHTCSACGTLWDQDENAAINILRRGIPTYMANVE